MKSQKFLRVAPSEKVIEALKHVQKDRRVKLYKERPEVMKVVEALALNHELLRSMKKQSYVTSFIHTVSRMRIDDE